MGRSTEQGDHDQLKELYSAGNLTVLATDLLPHQDPVQLDFHFRLTPQTSAHWHGLLCDHRLFLDIPYRALDQGNQESLTATLEYVEEKTNVDSVFVNFQNNRNDRGEDLLSLVLRAAAANSDFSFLRDPLPPNSFLKRHGQAFQVTPTKEMKVYSILFKLQVDY
ncbi:hypothetical protein HJG60_009317 [Phyllostomus discolor]|uniref:Ornithine decarboxylase antizyme 3 n=1 Tax=Phyllostomus discolor TaxID=89673 RepID=A0A834DCL8_9CHIR|nr:hypothetical protein HJG60_009317 [Phyllostomus discolor]